MGILCAAVLSMIVNAMSLIGDVLRLVVVGPSLGETFLDKGTFRQRLTSSRTQGNYDNGEEITFGWFAFEATGSTAV